MTPQNLATYVRKKTRTDASSFPDTLLMIYANIAKNDICAAIIKTDEDYFGLKFTRDLVAGQRNYGISSDVITGLKFVEAKIDGINQKHLDPFNLTKLRVSTDEASIVSYMSGRNWGYYIFGKQFWLLSDTPIIDVDDGLTMWANILPADLTDMTSTTDMSAAPSNTEFGIPKALHELLARRMIIEYKNSQEKPIPLTEKEQKFDFDLADKIRLLTSFNVDDSIVPEQSKNDDGNAGADY